MTIVVLSLTNPFNFDRDLELVVSNHPELRVTSSSGNMDSFMQVHGSAVLTNEPEEFSPLAECEN